MIRTMMTRAVAAAGVLLLAVSVLGASAVDGAEEHEVLGRFSIESEAGGAVWAFLPDGLLVITGPGDISSEGTWVAAAGERDFDATVSVTVSGQVLDVLGQVSPDSDRVAVYVLATEPTRPDDAVPWPPDSRLIGERFGMLADPSPSAMPLPEDCARPEWVEDVVDWDGCGVAILIEN